MMFCTLALGIFQCRPSHKTIRIKTAAELQQILSSPLHDVHIRIDPGEYGLTPRAVVDSTCGNCEDPLTPVSASAGLVVTGSGVHIVGPESGRAILNTNAGYGVFFQNCEDCSITRLIITGGVRDADGNATDAAVVVKHSSVVISECELAYNIGDSSLVAEKVVGIMGIAGREGSFITIQSNRILGNSWDGIALYRDAEAVIRNNIIDGIDKATGAFIGGGRGVGIGVTWDAQATIEGNLVTRYWKGIGLFVDANATVRENVVEDIITWGISLWDAEKGQPRGRIDWNAIYDTGACGVAIIQSLTVPSPGYLRNNAVVHTGQNPKYDDPDYYCFQCGLAIHSASEEFMIGDNWFTGNRRASEELPDYDIPEEKFRRTVQPLIQRLKGHSALQRSHFLRDFSTGD